MKKLLLHYLLLCTLLCTIKISKADVVTVSGRQILVNNKPYLIKGICYRPTPIGSETRSWTTLTQDLGLMVEAGINTIRVYTPIDNEAVLNEISAAGIKVIMGIGWNTDGVYDISSGTFINYIRRYKNHDAILFWEFGNEYNYNPQWFENDLTNWYTALNDAANQAHIEDPNHPVSTAHGELPTRAVLTACPNVDVWGMNVYRWDNPEAIFDEWKNVSNLPMFLSETGGDRYMTATMHGYNEGENQQAQADATRNILNDIFPRQDICSGVTLFEFCDEWNKAGNPNTQDIGGWAPNSGGVPYDGAANEEYWGIVDIERNKMQAFDVVKEIYNSITTGFNNLDIKDGIKVYPNPSDKIVNIEVELRELINTPYSILNNYGNIIKQGIIKSKSFRIQRLNPGVYNLYVNYEKIKINRKIIIY